MSRRQERARERGAVLVEMALLVTLLITLVLGVFENMVAGYLPDLIGQELKGVVSLLVILTVLLVKPSGLFGSQRVERV